MSIQLMYAARTSHRQSWRGSIGLLAEEKNPSKHQLVAHQAVGQKNGVCRQLQVQTVSREDGGCRQLQVQTASREDGGRRHWMEWNI